MSIPPENNWVAKAPSHRPFEKLLRAGPLQVEYERGALRYLKLGDFEVLRMIYSAVRDHNWDTVEPVINGYGTGVENSFQISYEAEYRAGDIHFRASYQITGDERGHIVFSMDGEALSTFRKNRIGFCILHPVKECAGQPCEIIEADGKVTAGRFPEDISPHQPFKNIRSMRWPLPGGAYARLDFSGDIFETEDQRNWTDASYKTYCTPLEQPFPVLIEKGTRIQQRVELHLEGPVPEFLAPAKATYTLSLASDRTVPLPALGVGRSSEVAELNEEDIRRIKNLGFNHYRVDVHPYRANWAEDFRRAVAEARQLDLRLELALHLDNPAGELDSFIAECQSLSAPLESVLLFGKNAKATPGELIESAIPRLRSQFPDLKIGVGTDAYFTELNRNRPPAAPADFLTFSLNPQVHAFDDASLTETLEAQGYVVASAGKFSAGKPVRVSPVTLKPRFNPNATGPEPEPLPNQLPAAVDVRQASLYGAAWTIGSIKYLAEAGAESITYYETAGRRGLFLPADAHYPDNVFPTGPGTTFPMYALFQAMLEFTGADVLVCKSNNPLVFDGLTLQKGNARRVLLANFTAEPVEVQVAPVRRNVRLRLLTAEQLTARPEWVSQFLSEDSRPLTGSGPELTVSLPPFASGVLDMEEDKIK